jgi:hypothetical protein
MRRIQRRQSYADQETISADSAVPDNALRNQDAVTVQANNGPGLKPHRSLQPESRRRNVKQLRVNGLRAFGKNAEMAVRPESCFNAIVRHLRFISAGSLKLLGISCRPSDFGIQTLREGCA